MNKLLKMANYYNELENNHKAFGLFSDNKDIEKLLSDYKKYPHALLISFIVDDETDSGEAESVPMIIKEKIGTLDIDKLSKIEYHNFIDLFVKNNISRNPENNAKLIFDMISLLMSNYNGDASKIWNDKPSSKELKRRIIEFKGMNHNKVNLFSLILVNKFKIELLEYSTINISNDRNVRKSMEEIKLIDKNSTYEDMKYICKILNPNYPGIFDSFFWAMGEYFFNNQEYKINNNEFIENCILASLQVI